jgi:hypothetical protein
VSRARGGFCNRLNTNSYRWHRYAALGSARTLRRYSRCSTAAMCSKFVKLHDLQYRSGRTAGRYASAARAFISPTAFEQARGGALEAGGGRVGFAGGGLF